MKCPKCGKESRVTDSRERMMGIYRRRKCLSCGYKFSSFEVVATKGTSGKIRQLYNTLSSIDLNVLKELSTWSGSI